MTSNPYLNSNIYNKYQNFNETPNYISQPQTEFLSSSNNQQIDKTKPIIVKSMSYQSNYNDGNPRAISLDFIKSFNRTNSEIYDNFRNKHKLNPIDIREVALKEDISQHAKKTTSSLVSPIYLKKDFNIDLELSILIRKFN